MLWLLLGVLMQIGPVGIDFAAIPAGPARQHFEYWIVVHSAGGKTFDYGEWCKFGGVSWTRERVMNSVEAVLKDNGCKVRRDGNVLVVRSLNGSPVTEVEVRIRPAKTGLGAAPVRTWALRSPLGKAVAPPPREVAKP